MAFLDRRTAGKAIERARTRGYFAATESARAFALIRPHEGIWANVVNNYLLGRTRRWACCTGRWTRPT